MDLGLEVVERVFDVYPRTGEDCVVLGIQLELVVVETCGLVNVEECVVEEVEGFRLVRVVVDRVLVTLVRPVPDAEVVCVRDDLVVVLELFLVDVVEEQLLVVCGFILDVDLGLVVTRGGGGAGCRDRDDGGAGGPGGGGGSPVVLVGRGFGLGGGGGARGVKEEDGAGGPGRGGGSPGVDVRVGFVIVVDGEEDVVGDVSVVLVVVMTKIELVLVVEVAGTGPRGCFTLILWSGGGDTMPDNKSGESSPAWIGIWNLKLILLMSSDLEMNRNRPSYDGGRHAGEMLAYLWRQLSLR